MQKEQGGEGAWERERWGTGHSVSQGQTPWGLQHGENFGEAASTRQAEVVSHRHGGIQKMEGGSIWEFPQRYRELGLETG